MSSRSPLANTQQLACRPCGSFKPMILLKLRGSIDVESVKGMEHVSAVLPLAGGRVAFVQKGRLSAPSEIQDKLVAIARSAHKLPGSTRTHALAARTVVSHVTHQRRALLYRGVDRGDDYFLELSCGSQ